MATKYGDEFENRVAENIALSGEPISYNMLGGLNGADRIRKHMDYSISSAEKKISELHPEIINDPDAMHELFARATLDTIEEGAEQYRKAYKGSVGEQAAQTFKNERLKHFEDIINDVDMNNPIDTARVLDDKLKQVLDADYKKSRSKRRIEELPF